MSAIFTHGDEQLRLARAVAASVARKSGTTIKTRIEPAGRFYLAEDYHQKYRLRAHRRIAGELTAIYPESTDFVNSTAAARLNGYLAGYGTRAAFEKELPRLGLSDSARAAVAAIVRNRLH